MPRSRSRTGAPASVVLARIALTVQGGLWLLALIRAVIETKERLSGPAATGQAGYLMRSALSVALFASLMLVSFALAARCTRGRRRAQLTAVTLEGALSLLGLLATLWALLLIQAVQTPAQTVQARVFTAFFLALTLIAFTSTLLLVRPPAREYFRRRLA